MHTVVLSDLVEIPEIEWLIRKLAHLKSENCGDEFIVGK